VTPPLPAGILDRDVLTFVGREVESADLFRVWDEAASASARRVTLIGGEPGIGKTRLVAEVASQINQAGGAVAWGRSDPDGFVPHQPVAEVLHQLVSWTATDAALSSAVDRHRATLGWLVPQLAEPGDPSDDDDGARFRLVAACTAVLRAASQAQPLLVVLDDVHWAGAPTISLVRHLLNGVHGHPIVLALAYRDNQAPPSSPLGGLLSDLRRDSGATRVALGPLDLDALGAIVPDDPAAALAATNGNPFLVGELVRHLQGGGGAGGLEGALDALEARLARLPDVTRKILDTTAVAGAVVDVELLRTVSGQPDDAVVAALDTAVQERVLREVPDAIDRYRFAHALTREAVLGGLGATRRALLHQRVGEALESMAALIGELVAYWVVRQVLAARNDPTASPG
jgi:predicted ATPase